MLLDTVSLSALLTDISALGDSLFHGETSSYIEDIINNKTNHKVFAVFRDEKSAGFLILSTCLDEAEILEVAVAEDLRRKGIASELISEISDWCQKNGMARIFLEVRRSNLAARKCYEKFGFLENGCRKNYYRDPVEDAVLMSGEIPLPTFCK